jgi:hypothetical protein
MALASRLPGLNRSDRRKASWLPDSGLTGNASGQPRKVSAATVRSILLARGMGQAGGRWPLVCRQGVHTEGRLDPLQPDTGERRPASWRTLLCEHEGMLDQRPKARDFGAWLAEHWRVLLIILLLAPVLGPAVALFCLIAGPRAVIRSRSAEVAQQNNLGEDLDALIAAVLPPAVYGCTVWGLEVVVQPSDWAGWIMVSLVAGLVGLVLGVLGVFYIFGYSMGVAEAEAHPKLSRAPEPRMSLNEQMLRPFRRGRL